MHWKIIMKPAVFGVPHLKTIQDQLRFDLEKKIVKHQVEIECWFRGQWLKHKPLFYCSVDLRNAGFKLAAVDTNVFPGGFNNLNPDFLPLCVQAATQTLSQLYPNCNNILILAESHTRNPHYLKSLHILQTILTQAGFNIRIGTLRPIDDKETFNLPDATIVQWPIVRKDNRIVCADFEPCIVLLNNDLSEGVPEILQNLKQPIIPELTMGWNIRSKYDHFLHYELNASKLASILNIDPWLIVPLFSQCIDVDFLSSEKDACIIEKAEELFEAVVKKYKEYQIKHKPFLVIKSDAGTYGMAVLMVKEVKEILNLNRKQRTKMSTRKGGMQVDKVLIQEGVYTMEAKENQATAEPVVYMIGSYVIGGFYRIHTGRGMQDNLNAPGMHFEPLAFDTCCNTPDERLSPHDSKNQFYAYSVIARLAHLATRHEQGSSK
ncbi:MAG TPA: glutamate--cysteine ligase [Gammaproteobacteria bacterium]|nr:glutamate--cysteine ligase [Gammaproteobacteria bacterium]